MKDQLLRALQLAFLLLLVPTITSGQWRKVNIVPAQFYNEVFFTDANHGWITTHTGQVYRTIDAGNSWQSSIMPNALGSFNRDICFVSNLTGFIAGDDGIWKTTDGGVSWNTITPPNAPFSGNAGCWFIDANVGVYGFGPCNGTTVRFYRTTNGGATWDSVLYDHPVDVAVGGITYSNGTFYAAGGVGNFWKSTDNGANWTYSSTGSAGFHEDIFAIGGDLHLTSVDGSVCGITGSSKMLRSGNGGAAFQSIPFPGVIMWGVWFYSIAEGWCGGDFGRAYHTTDGGATWTEKSCGISKTDRIDDICFPDATHGWAVGDGIYKYVGDSWAKRPDTINFGDVVVGLSSPDSNARITAVGSGLQVLNRTLTGTDALDFRVPGGLGPQSIGSCQDGLTAIRFAPLSEGIKVARVEFNIQGVAETPVVYLKGRGVRPRISADSLVRFDTIFCGTTGIDTVWVRNVGTYLLTISNASILAPVNGSFLRVAPASFPVTVRPGDSTPFIIQVTLPSPGPLIGTLSISSNDPDKSVINIGLVAHRRSVMVALTPDTILLPPRPFGVASNGCILYRNMGDGEQIIAEVVAPTVDNAITQAPGVGGARIARNGMVMICFTAIANDTDRHVLRYRVRTQPCDLDTFITVIYQASNPIIGSESERTLVSGACDTQAVDTIHITNTGNAPLAIAQPFFSGPDAARFTIEGSAQWPDTIPVGGSRVVVVRYDFGSGPATGSAAIHFPNNDKLLGKSDWIVNLTVTQGVSELTLSRRVIDVGDICLNDSARIESTILGNIGTAPAVIRAVTPVNVSDAVSVAFAPVGAAIAPATNDSILFSVKPPRTGAFSVTYVVEYDPCDRTDTVTVIGRGIGVDLAATPPGLDYGSLQVGVKVDQMLTLVNNGNTPATITAWSFDPVIPGAIVESPGVPFTLDPGATIQVVVSLTPPDTGSYRLKLSGIGEGPCADTLVASINAIAVKGSVIATRHQVSFDTIFSCDNSAIPDSLHLVNKGTAPISILGLRLAGGSSSAFRIETVTSPSQPIAPAESLAVVVSLGADGIGAMNDTLIIELDQPEQPTIRIPLNGRRERADLAVRDINNQILPSLRFPDLTTCAPSAELPVRIVNTGTVVDSITVTAGGSEFTLVDAPTIVLAPGRDTIIRVRATMSASGTAKGTLAVRSMPCALNASIDLEAIYRRVALAGDSAIAFGIGPGGSSRDTTLVVRNISDDPVAIDGASITPPFVLLTQTPFTIAPRDSIVLQLRYVPRSENDIAQGMLFLSHQLPCADTLPVVLSAAAEERFTVTVRGGQARGRWGTIVSTPIGYEDRRNAPVRSIDLAVTASPFLLDPVGARFNDPSITGWTITRTGYDAASGTLRLRLAAGDGATPLPTTDTLLMIEYLVLRGGEIASDVTIEASGLAPNIVALTEPGLFALEDYCDAHGRLLRTHGSLALDQNAPNPFNPSTVIEFETPFSDHVLLAVYDAVGHEVARLVDDVIPAGRRRIVFDARELPSGVYTYKLVVGLQVLSRRMVVTK